MCLIRFTCYLPTNLDHRILSVSISLNFSPLWLLLTGLFAFWSLAQFNLHERTKNPGEILCTSPSRISDSNHLFEVPGISDTNPLIESFRFQPLRVSEISDTNHSEFLKFHTPTTQSFWNFRFQPLRVSEISDSNHSEFLKFQIPTTEILQKPVKFLTFQKKSGNFRYQSVEVSEISKINHWNFQMPAIKISDTISESYWNLRDLLHCSFVI